MASDKVVLLLLLNGEGRRFQAAGYALPKPMLDVGGVPLYQRALSAYDQLATTRRLVIGDHLLPHLPEPLDTRLVVTTRTAGPLATVLLPPVVQFLKRHLDEELLLADGDAFFENPKELSEALGILRASEATAGTTRRETTDPAVTYAKLSVGGYVWDVAEGTPISDWSLTGPYWWRRVEDFLRHGTRAAKHGATTLAPVFREVLNEARMVLTVPVTTFVHLGTPAAYEDYLHRKSG